MDYIHCVQRGVDFIEAHIDTDLTLASVASAAGLSQWHYQRIFKALTNETLKSYIRARRLSVALEKLMSSRLRVLDIALLAGYESQESFTRAFKAHFNRTPGQIRSQGKPAAFIPKLVIDADYIRHIHQHVSLEPVLVHWESLRMVGMLTSVYGSDSAKNNFAGKLPRLWSEFLSRESEVQNHQQGTGYGIIHAESESDELLTYMAGFAVADETPVPEGMNEWHLPSSRYAVFEHKGNVSTLDNTVNYIYSNWLLGAGKVHSGQPDLEIYGDDYIPDSDQSLMYYAIPVVQ